MGTKDMFQGRLATLVVTMACSSGFLLFGYDQGVMSGILGMPAWLEQFPMLDVGNGGSAQLQGTVVAIYEIGCLLGSLFIYVAGDWLGRRRAIWLGCTILICGALLQTLSYGIPQMIIGRIVTGVGNGINTSTIPVWHSETTSATSRGRAVSIELATTVFGLMIAYWVDFGLAKVNGPISFRLPLALQIVPAVVTIIFVCFAPESPRWLLKNRTEAESRATLAQLSMHTGAEREQAIDADFLAIQAALEEEKEALPKNDKGEIIAPFRACFTNGKERYFHRMMLGVGGQFIQQICGINLVVYYAPTIFEKSVGMSRDLSTLMSGFLGINFFIFSLIPIFIIERTGRRSLFIWGLVVQTICMVVLSITTQPQYLSRATGIVAATAVFAYEAAFGVGLLAIPWLIAPEYSPLPIRASASALASSSNWLFNFVIVEITPVSIQNIGGFTYVYLAIFNFLFIWLVYFFYPETAGLSLEQIDLLFNGPKVHLYLPDELRYQERHHHAPQIASGGHASLADNEKDLGVGVEHLEDQRV